MKLKLPKFLRRTKKQEEPSSQAEQTETPDEKPSSPLNIVYSGHRGSGANSVQYVLPEDERTPENSLASFKQALKDGIESIEFDVYRSKDGVLMVTHDDDLSKNAVFDIGKDYPEPKMHFVSQKNSTDIQTNFDISRMLSAKENEDGTFVGVRIATGEHIKRQDFDEYWDDYKAIPTFKDLLSVVAKGNSNRQKSGLQNIKLNMELKGDNTGELVAKELEEFNKKAQERNIPKIKDEDMYYLSFQKQELRDVVKENPKAKVILGVPTEDTYLEVGDNFTLINHELSKDNLDRKVLGFDKELKEMPERNKGLDGVDMSLWDIGDDVLKYYGENKIPVHIAVTPWGKNTIKHEYIAPAINNIQKIAKFQGKYFNTEPKPFIFAKTDTPKYLQKSVEQSSHLQGKREIIDASEYIISNSQSQDSVEIPIYQKPNHLFKERMRQEQQKKENLGERLSL